MFKGKPFEESRENARRAVKALQKRFSWIKEVKERKKVKGDEKLSRGFDVLLTDHNGNDKWIVLIVNYSKKKSLTLRARKQGVTVKEFKKALHNTWAFLAAGGSPEDPQIYVVTRLDLLPDEAFTRLNEKPEHQGNLGDRFYVNLKNTQWSCKGQPNITSESEEDNEDFELMREPY